MAVILNIQTSAKFCSVAVTVDGAVDMILTDDKEMNHARFLAPAVEKLLEHLKSTGRRPDAVAVSSGPGSYTGLRIGLSFAKGLCFSRDIPLVTIPTLKIMAVKAQFKRFDWEGDELLVPMMDAGRNEVYAAVYDFALKPLTEPQPLILEADSLSGVIGAKKAVFIGDGSQKAEKILTQNGNYLFLGSDMPTAADMLALAEKAWREQDFADVAYSVPEYLKEYKAVIARNKVLDEARQTPSQKNN